MREKSALLLTACLLTGLHTIPQFWNSQTHYILFNHMKGEICTLLIQTPLRLESILALLIIAVWNLVPQDLETYIDSWLLTGMAIMHGMLSLDVEDGRIGFSENPEGSGHVTHQMVRTWNLLCLTHIQYVSFCY